MNKVFRNVLMAVAGATLGIAAFLGVQAATTDTITVSVTIPGTLTITDDGVALSIASLTPETADTGEANVITVASNSGSGFNVTIDLDDLDTPPTAGQLCDNDGTGACDTLVFDGDGTASYISFTSADGGSGALAGLTGATFTTGETKLGTSSYAVYDADTTTNAATLGVSYDVYADSTIAPDTYEGTITFTIVSK